MRFFLNIVIHEECVSNMSKTLVSALPLRSKHKWSKFSKKTLLDAKESVETPNKTSLAPYSLCVSELTNSSFYRNAGVVTFYTNSPPCFRSDIKVLPVSFKTCLITSLLFE
jgi:hypothetical protein